MDMKWLAIMVVGVVTAGMGAAAIDFYTKGQCKSAYVQSTKTADEINKICGK